MAQLNNEEESFEDFLDKQIDALKMIPSEEQEELAKLVHNVFTTELGKKLLKRWLDDMLLAPSITPESTTYQAGLIEGEKNFVRRLVLTIHKIEKLQERPSIFRL